MKKNLILSATAFAALAFVGCTQEDVVSGTPSVNNAIEFGTYLGRDAQKRASVVDKTSLGTQGFGVYAYYTKNTDYTVSSTIAPNFMKNEKVTSSDDGDTWTYSPLKYWPNNTGDKVSFFAYAPYKENPSFDAADNKPIVTFTVENDVTNQQDLLWSKTDNRNLNMTKPDINTKVMFNFAHALSRIGFTVQAAVDQTAAGGELDRNTTITVEKVMLSGAAHTYNNNGVVTESSTGVFYVSGKLNMNNTESIAAWSDQAGSQFFTLREANLQNTTIAGGTGNSTQKQLNKNDSYLMIIPQNFTDNKLYVYVKYKVTTTDEKLAEGKSEITNYISTPVNINFESGKAYTLNLVLGMTSVKVAADVTEWAEQGGTTVNLPLNTELTTQP